MLALTLLGVDPKDIPVERTVYRIIDETKERYTGHQRALDQPFEIRLAHDLPEGVTPADLPALMDMMVIASYPKMPAFTVRRARWVPVVRRMVDEADHVEVFYASTLYANRERWSVLVDKPIDTRDLDTFFSFKRFDQGLTAYHAGIKAGLLPAPPSDTLIRDKYPLDPRKAKKELERKDESHPLPSYWSGLDDAAFDFIEKLDPLIDKIMNVPEDWHHFFEFHVQSIMEEKEDS